SPDPEAERSASEEEVAQIVGRLLLKLTANGRHVVFILDDMQWAESSGVLGILRILVNTLARESQRQGENAVCFIFTSRTESTNDETSDLLAFKQWLSEMDDQEILKVHTAPLYDATHRKMDHWRDRLLTGTRWLHLLPTEAAKIRAALRSRDLTTPLEVLVFLRAALEHGLLQPGSGRVKLSPTADLNSLPVDSDFDDQLKAHLETLDRDLLDLLECCSLIGTQFKPSLVAEVFAVDLITVLKQLRIAESRQLVLDIREIDDRFEFVDKRVVRVLRTMCSDDPESQLRAKELARAYHKRILRHLERAYSLPSGDSSKIPLRDLVAIADHAWAIHDSIPDAAVSYAMIAGTQLRLRCAFRQADRVLRRGIALAKSMGDLVSGTHHVQLLLEEARV
ncbi:MAG: hypothetical protein QGF59_17480, partial [Pirellulaceae bacterium]|nr:hypothetical protein [Pirellulaceae bacterium]